MKQMIVLITCVAALAACNKGPQVSAENASVAEVDAKVHASGAAGDMVMQAGEWRVTSTLDEMNIPGMPVSAQAQMKQMMGQHRVSNFEYCLTPDEAKRPGGKFFTGKQANNCRYDHFTMGGGKIDAVMHCASGGGGAMTMTMNGTYSPGSYATKVAMDMDGGPQGKMSMKMHSEAHRVGQCTPEDEASAKQK